MEVHTCNTKKVRQNGRIVYEKTPTYYRVPAVPKRISAMDPDMKIIYIVCDNSRRALSRYFHLWNMGKFFQPFLFNAQK